MFRSYRRKASRPKKSTYRRRRTYRRSRALPNKRGIGNIATVKETYPLSLIAGSLTRFDFNITSLVRAKQVAQFYQEYRVTGIKFIFRPQVDTFPSGGTQQLPYLWYMNDYARSLPNTLNFDQLASLGTKPIRFDDKSIMKTLKPAVILSAEPSTVLLPALIKKSPWLPTNATPTGSWTINSPVHNGALFGITKQDANDATEYIVDVQVSVEFRRPSLPVSVSEMM